MSWAYNNLVDGGYFCIEVRGQKNEIYQLGTKVHGEEHAYIYNEHYRRFLNFNELCLSLQSLNFTIEYAAEQKGFAPYEGNDETYIRVIVKK